MAAATLKDVALRAGVSIKTVSNVVHGYEHVTEEKRERVQAAIKELNYQPNLPARYLRKAKVGVIALAIPYISNPYFSDIGNAIITAAASHSYTVLLDPTQAERSREVLVINGLRPHLIDGAILSPLALEAEDFQDKQIEMPVVLLGERILNVPYDHIIIDNVAAAQLATRHLIEQGCRRIAAIGAQEVTAGETARLRLRGYQQALAEANLPLDTSLIVHVAAYNREDGREAMHRLLAQETKPDAVFCFNDLLAAGALRALYEAGYSVPHDIAVVGFDNIEETRFSIPSLTTIEPDKQKIAELAVSFLIGRIDGSRSGPAERVEVPFQLIVRESSTR